MHTRILKSKPAISQNDVVIEIIESTPDAGLQRTIITNEYGKLVIYPSGRLEGLKERTLPYDNYVQIIHGSADLAIKARRYELRLGEGLVIPAYTIHSFYTSIQFKMISTFNKYALEL
ncbi:MAG: hypothetical protein K0Q79_2962 [Flavipsychrobacter sp.]|jgi:mannose-6-phosphate isomerase-like protein (cupin superfamily)|nr:hypothetical protein [Flavipsychrobacter sp.]